MVCCFTLKLAAQSQCLPTHQVGGDKRVSNKCLAAAESAGGRQRSHSLDVTELVVVESCGSAVGANVVTKVAADAGKSLENASFLVVARNGQSDNEMEGRMEEVELVVEVGWGGDGNLWPGPQENQFSLRSRVFRGGGAGGKASIGSGGLGLCLRL